MLPRQWRCCLLLKNPYRNISSSQSCLRDNAKRKNQTLKKSLRLRSQVKEGLRQLPKKTPFVSTTDLQTELNSFLYVLKLRIENLLYAPAARSATSTQLSDEEFETVLYSFRDAVTNNLKEKITDGNYETSPSRIPSPQILYNSYAREGIRGLDSIVLEYFRQYTITHEQPILRSESWPTNLASVDMRNPGEWFPAARSIRRKIIMHVGPTNSGKTYRALKRLEVAKSGWYGGPLRLLAHEVFNRMNYKGIKCNLITGEEIRIVDQNAPLTSSTIEMFSESARYDVAVIDEIQMIGDGQRGFAWTIALIGLCAKEVHLCGEEAAVPLVEEIAKELGEEVEVNRYDRLSPLKTSTEPLGDYKNIQKGDCVVAFSRKRIFEIKDQIEETTRLRCALVYGGLPPETRSMQAELFNDPTSGYDVIVASDAIGMGLNLYPLTPRSRLIF